MAEVVYKSIPDLDPYSGSIDGSETIPFVKAGKTYRRSWQNFFGTGWVAALLSAFDVFKAPDAIHADDADTVEGEDAAALHNAALLTGAINLDRIPAQLTGKNAATATLAATATNALACSGNAATATLAAGSYKNIIGYGALPSPSSSYEGTLWFDDELGVFLCIRHIYSSTYSWIELSNF